jgi:BirA family biotin operon repressor/biotin-[acetyl-CoA-carboxylase] ligase
MTTPSTDFDPQYLTTHLSRQYLPWEVLHLAHTTSTNDIVHAQARAGHAEGLVVVTDHQTQGRGQQGRSWLDQPTQALLCSILLRPTWLPPQQTPHLVNAFVATLAETLAQFVTVPVAIKWPNDVVVAIGEGMAKVAGVLCEGQVNSSGIQYICVGWGVNVHGAPPVGVVNQPVTHLAAHAVHPLTRTAVLQAQLEAFAVCYQRLRHDVYAYQATWQARQYLIGHEVRIRHGDGVVVGRALGLAQDGGLMLETAGGLQTVHGGWIEVE